MRNLETLPFQGGYFDRVLCYSVLNLAHYEKSIEEISRVTKSGGLVYISTNGIGRYIYDIVECPNPAPDFNPRKYGALTLWNTLIGKRRGLSPQTGGVVTSKLRTIGLLRHNGFEIIDSGPEGQLRGGTESFLSGRYWGLVSTFDVLARKCEC